MAPHPGPARQDRGREEDRQETPGALRTRLHQSAQALRTPADWAACLRLAARLPRADWANIVLITAQRPGATQLRDYQQWTATGRQVRKGEHGIVVFSIPPPPRRAQPPGEDDEPEPAWQDAGRVIYLWDLSQTTGPPASDDAVLPPRDPPAQVRDALCWLARRLGYAVEAEHGPPPDGTVFWAVRRIRIPPQITDEQAVWALAHQLGHVLLHNHPGDSAYPPGTTTTGCTGLRKAEADSIAYTVCARHGIAPAGSLPYPASWAGTDPRAQPAAAILAAGHRITTAAARITAHTVRILHGDDPAPRLTTSPGPATRAARPGANMHETASSQVSTPVTQPAATPSPQQQGAIRRVLADALAFYTSQLDGSWAPSYLHARGITSAAIQDWRIGYAPAGWTTLTGHLRRLGCDDDVIQAAGLAARSSRGTLIDRFRDRIMLPVCDAYGTLTGFTGRASPGAGPEVPRYLNSPETALYRKSHLLFGLHQAALAEGAIPVIAEGPFDAIAVSIADPGRHAGLAPCGTALTTPQAALLSQAADLSRTGIIVAFDDDPAGRKAAIRAHSILRPLTPDLQSAVLDSKDPAAILQQDGPDALRTILREHRQPLSALLIDASIGKWGRRLRDTDGPLLAMRSTASLIASLLPDGTASQIHDITAGRELQTTDDLLRPVACPEIPQIAAILPADTTYQIVRAAGKLGCDATDVLAEVANAATRSTPPPAQQPRAWHDRQGRSPAAPQPSPARLASTSFPGPPLTQHPSPPRPQAASVPPGSPTSPHRRARPPAGGFRPTAKT